MEEQKNDTQITNTSQNKQTTQQQHQHHKDFIGELNEKQIEKFRIFQNQVKDQAKIFFKENPQLIPKYTDENQLVRQFIARDYKEKDAFKLWEKWVNWMKDNDADNIKECNIQDELKTGKCFLHGYDKKENPILVVQTRYHIPKQIPISQSKQFYLYLLEKAIQESDRVGTGRITVIWDRNGFSRKNFDTELQSMFKELIGIMQDTYAERLDSMIILHPNWFFRMVYGMVKIFLSQRTKNKIHVLPELHELQTLIDPDQMLQEHGGTSEFQYKFPFSVFRNETIQQEFTKKLVEQKVIPQFEQKQKIINDIQQNDQIQNNIENIKLDDSMEQIPQENNNVNINEKFYKNTKQSKNE